MLNKVARYRGTDNDEVFAKQPGYIYTNNKGVYLINQKREVIKLYSSEYLDEKLAGVVDSDTIMQNIASEFGSAFHFMGSLNDITQLPSSAQNGDVYQIGEKEYAYNGSEFVELGFNIDLSEYAKTNQIPTKVSDLQNDSGYLTEHQDISGKADTSSVYTKEQSDAKFLTEHQDISGKANASDVYTKEQADGKFLTEHQSLTQYAKISDIPTKVSDLQNDSGYLTQHQDISGKVDKIEGKGLSTEDYTTAEKTKLNGIETDAQVNIIESISVDNSTLTITNKSVNIDLSGKVDKVQGKSLIDDTQIDRLSQVTNYDDTSVLASLNSKANADSVYTKAETDNKIQQTKSSISPSDIITNIKYYNDIEYNQQGFVSNINNMTEVGIYVIDASLGHNPTPVQDDKGILIVTQNMQQFISNKTDTFGKTYFRNKDANQIYSGTWIASAMSSDLNNKVTTEPGKGLSTNDFTNSYKTKLDSLSNYNDTEVRLLIATKANATDVYTSQQTDAKISEAISNLGSLASGVLHFKGIKNSLQEVQAIAYEQASIGDVWQVGTSMYACNQKENSQLGWIEIGGTVDLSAYAEKNNVYNKTQVDAKIDNLQAQIGTISTILNDIIG